MHDYTSNTIILYIIIHSYIVLYITVLSRMSRWWDFSATLHSIAADAVQSLRSDIVWDQTAGCFLDSFMFFVVLPCVVFVCNADIDSHPKECIGVKSLLEIFQITPHVENPGFAPSIKPWKMLWTSSGRVVEKHETRLNTSQNVYNTIWAVRFIFKICTALSTRIRAEKPEINTTQAPLHHTAIDSVDTCIPIPVIFTDSGRVAMGYKQGCQPHVRCLALKSDVSDLTCSKHPVLRVRGHHGSKCQGGDWLHRLEPAKLFDDVKVWTTRSSTQSSTGGRNMKKIESSNHFKPFQCSVNGPGEEGNWKLTPEEEAMSECLGCARRAKEKLCKCFAFFDMWWVVAFDLHPWSFRHIDHRLTTNWL